MKDNNNSSLLINQVVLYFSFPVWQALLVMASGRHSTYSTESKPERVSKQLSYRPALASPIDADIRPLVILYGWLVAKSKHIHKYGDYYLGHGFDVLHVKITPGQMMWPEAGHKVVGQVMDFVSDTPHINKPLLMHGFSVGGHLIGESYVKVSMANIFQILNPCG